MLARIRAELGEEVGRVVEACSDTNDPDDARSWRELKASYLAHLADVDDEATLRVVLADKVHNARSIVRDYRSEGPALWSRIPNRTRDDQLWYYRALADFFAAAHPGPLVEDLRRAVDEIEELVSARER
jgi:(p)ppGpp synthase/HD superfamily hydrolase